MHTIALDYDDTFTTDPDGWYRAMLVLKQAGFRIVGCTFRYPEEEITDRQYIELCDRIIYCSRESKFTTAGLEGEKVDIWIDDIPQWIHTGVPVPRIK